MLFHFCACHSATSSVAGLSLPAIVVPWNRCGTAPAQRPRFRVSILSESVPPHCLNFCSKASRLRLAVPPTQSAMPPRASTHRNHPEAHVDHVENKGQADRHQHHSRPHRPLAGLVRDLQPGENSGLQIFRFENVRGGRILGDPGNLGQPHVHGACSPSSKSRSGARRD